MALPTSGPISLSQIQTEFGGSNPISLSEYYRDGPYVTANNTNIPLAGAISVNQFYGGVKQFMATISSPVTTPLDLRTFAINAGWNGSDYLVVVNDTRISSNTTASASVTISGSYPNGVKFINNGFVIGMGGKGGNENQNGSPGGAGIKVETAVSITNAGIIAGGGGGGGSSPAFGWCGVVLTTAGGGGASGQTQSLGGNGTTQGNGNPSSLSGYFYSIPGAAKQAGACGVVNSPSGKGGTWGNPGDNGGYTGGAAGAAVSGNSYVTWIAAGVRTGPLVG